MQNHRILYKIFQWTIKGLLVLLVGPAVLYFLIAISLSYIPLSNTTDDCSQEYEIFVSSNGVHTDIIIPVEYLSSDIRSQLQTIPKTIYIAFGWGDKNFYINTPEWKDLTPGIAINALFLQSEAAMHVTFYQRQSIEWKRIYLCEKQLHVLTGFILNSFKHDDNGKLMKMNFDGYTPYDLFFEAEGNFSLFSTCNTWVNKGFKKSAIKTAVWTPFDFGILYHIN